MYSPELNVAHDLGVETERNRIIQLLTDLRSKEENAEGYVALTKAIESLKKI